MFGAHKSDRNHRGAVVHYTHPAGSEEVFTTVARVAEAMGQLEQRARGVARRCSISSHTPAQ